MQTTKIQPSRDVSKSTGVLDHERDRPSNTILDRINLRTRSWTYGMCQPDLRRDRSRWWPVTWSNSVEGWHEYVFTDEGSAEVLLCHNNSTPGMYFWCALKVRIINNNNTGRMCVLFVKSVLSFVFLWFVRRRVRVNDLSGESCQSLVRMISFLLYFWSDSQFKLYQVLTGLYIVQTCWYIYHPTQPSSSLSKEFKLNFTWYVYTRFRQVGCWLRVTPQRSVARGSIPAAAGLFGAWTW